MSTATEILAPGGTNAEDEEIIKPMPGFLHSAVQPTLGFQLSQHRKFRVLSELDLRLKGKLLRPDLCLYRREPLDLSHEVPRRENPPLLVVEILSVGQGYGELWNARITTSRWS